ncbi:NAD-dependent epimerase/dehydratase family protein [Ottowia testudinis]|uniref:UDP-glucose 4-epimerase n=1 Tax=Ottowia testudinis TaxID=2816950 RepID=A0A975H405_9BURK|nr:NAD(P)-dependent oxidoreductase [Ottowia testudinis]QTD46354.1 NAD(P)-dependent oxidoreductase [Ottowia testudinis]
MRILLTGPTGAVGGEVLQQLLGTPHAITVFEKHSAHAEKVLAPHVDRIRTVWGDLTDGEAVAAACAGQDVVLHVAALIPPVADDKPALAEQVNVQGTANVIAGLQKNSPDAFLVYTSSISVYGDRIDTPWIRVGDPLQASVGDEYAKTKIKAEALVQACSLDWSIFRLTAIMGLDNHQVGKLMFHMPLATPLEICSPADTARALVHAIDQRAALRQRIFNLGGGPACRIRFDEFLQRSFSAFGLGKVDFPAHAFAEHNFHCGYYADSDVLEDVLHFQRDTVESHFQVLHQSISPFRRCATRLVSGIVKKWLLTQSEPYHAWKANDRALMARFFKTQSGDSSARSD